MMNDIALITPWPPQQSGIADYASDLARGLAHQGARVHVYTDAWDDGSSVGQPPHNNIHLLPMADFPGPTPFDRVIYQMGNNARFHRSMVLPLGRHGGIVHLHDLVLHHLVFDLTATQGDGRLYYRLLQHWYGSDAAHQIQQWNRIEDVHFVHSDRVTDIPLFDPILCYASGCIVHSEYARQCIQRRFPELPCEVVTQVYRQDLHRHRAKQRRSSGPLRVGVLGMVTPRTHTDLLLLSAADAMAKGANLQIEIAGAVMHESGMLESIASQLGIQDKVIFHGRVNDDAFHTLMQSIDVCVALRFPTMGETSGVVSRALQYGIPTVVNNVGWFGELPRFVTKLPCQQHAMQEQLGAWLWRHATDAVFHQQMRSEAEEYAHRALDFDAVNRHYLSVLNRFPDAREKSQHSAVA